MLGHDYEVDVTKILRCQEPMWNLPKLNILYFFCT